MSCLISRITCTRETSATKRSLRYFTFSGAAERTAPVLHFIYSFGRLFGHTDNCILVCKVIASFYWIEGMFLIVIICASRVISQRGVNSSLCGNGMRADWVYLRDNGNLNIMAIKFNRCPETRQPTTSYYHIMVDHKNPF